MILIVSDPADRSTNRVIDWLNFYEVDFLRIGKLSGIQFTSVQSFGELFNHCFEIDGSQYSLSDFDKIWYRRSYFDPTFTIPALEHIYLKGQVLEQLNSEKATITHFLHFLIGKNSLNSPLDLSLNKLVVLEYAKDCGLTIPNSLVTGNKALLQRFFEDHMNIITKNISGGVFLKTNTLFGNVFTTEVTQAMINELPENFFPMLFQKRIEKQFEVRTFFINDLEFSSAIFSQSDNKTKIDFRNYNHNKPNRTPPIVLPHDVLCSLARLMKQLNMKSGSVDFIVDLSGSFIFLEVNPIGQFAQVSIPCNYYLEQKIATSLTDK